MKSGFDSEKYLHEQSQAILERAGKFDDKLYLEFGGKLLCDFHAARVLPGFDPDTKIKLLQRMKDKIDIVICIYAGDIEKKKMRADFGLAYDTDTMHATILTATELSEADPHALTDATADVLGSAEREEDENLSEYLEDLGMRLKRLA